MRTTSSRNAEADATGRVVIIVGEHSANWSHWVEQMRHRAKDVEVIFRQANERFVAFALRVREFVRRRTEPIEVAVLLPSRAFDDDSLARGWEILATALHRMLQADRGQIVLVRSSGQRLLPA